MIQYSEYTNLGRIFSKWRTLGQSIWVLFSTRFVSTGKLSQRLSFKLSESELKLRFANFSIGICLKMHNTCNKEYQSFNNIIYFNLKTISIRKHSDLNSCINWSKYSSKAQLIDNLGNRISKRFVFRLGSNNHQYR